MTQDRAAADDLIQEVAAKALAANKGFEAGTNDGTTNLEWLIGRR
jgi:DNA-directed RNA polymerase specialized sigma24 family protein